MKSFYKDKNVVIYHADCLKALKEFDDESVDLFFFSPPYNLGNFRKASHWCRRRTKKASSGGKGVSTLKSEGKMEYSDHDDAMPHEEYVEWQRTILRLCYRKLKETGAIFYNHKPRRIDKVWDDRRSLIPFPLRQEIIWNKIVLNNWGGHYFPSNTERIFIVAKDKWKPTKEGLKEGEIWTVGVGAIVPLRAKKVDSTKHPAGFPTELARKVVRAGSKLGDLVVDPMMGAGTTLVAALELNRKTIGIDKGLEYCKMAVRRVTEVSDRGPTLF